jgi:hypothetical protein
VSVHEFVFALELSDEARFDAMLTELAKAVFAATGCSGDALAVFRDRLREALPAAANGHGRCDVRFHADGEKLHVAIHSPGQPERRTTFKLPNP